MTTDAGGGQHSILIRRNNTTGELAFYRCWTPLPVSLATLVRIAGIRWTAEENFQTAKGQIVLAICAAAVGGTLVASWRLLLGCACSA